MWSKVDCCLLRKDLEDILIQEDKVTRIVEFLESPKPLSSKDLAAEEEKKKAKRKLEREKKARKGTPKVCDYAYLILLATGSGSVLNYDFVCCSAQEG
jgi:hypothetical protein